MMNINEKNSNAVLSEAQEFFQSQGMSIIGEGYKEIATNPMLFESYLEALLEGVNANNYETMKQLMENSNKQILVESSTTGIAPIASLSMPVIRKLWPKFALKNALKEEVAKSPRFVISYMRPYMFRGKDDGTEERVYLPKGLKDNQLGSREKEVCVRGITLSSTAAGGEVNFTDDSTSGIVTNATGVAKAEKTGSLVKVIPLDRDFRLESVDVVGDGTHVASTKNYVVNATLDINNTIVYDLKVDKAAGGAETTITILVRVDLQKAVAKVTAFGFTANTTSIKLNIIAPLSSEYNELSWSVSFDLERRDVQIPTGQHINAPLPIEMLQDLNALYQIDGTKETTDLMTNVLAQKLDMDVLDFLKKSYNSQPGFYDYGEGQYPGPTEYTVTFDVRPAAGFAGGPKEWREEIKPVIDFLAQKIKNNTYLNTGMFVIVANPVDAQIISNIDWQFRGGQGSNVDGVDVDYSVGTYVGANSYRIISSVNVTPGVMFILFLPASDKQMTYKYYPYSFSVEHGYIDPNRSRVPSIMMTKRHTFESVLPAIGAINIVNNDGMGQFAPYIQYQAYNASDWDEVETYPKD